VASGEPRCQLIDMLSISDSILVLSLTYVHSSVLQHCVACVAVLLLGSVMLLVYPHPMCLTSIHDVVAIHLNVYTEPEYNQF